MIYLPYLVCVAVSWCHQIGYDSYLALSITFHQGHDQQLRPIGVDDHSELEQDEQKKMLWEIIEHVWKKGRQYLDATVGLTQYSTLFWLE
jgi:hypothetical protein